MSTRAVSVRRRRQVLAIVAGGTALGVAGLVTLAAWNDNEWVFGGTGPGSTGDGVGTSEFNVQQDAWVGAPPAALSATFADFESRAGDALTFNVDPTGLTPGDTIFAPVALTTTAASVKGTLTLQAPVAAYTAADAPDGDPALAAKDPADLLWNTLSYSVAVTDDAVAAANCTLAGFGSAGDLIVQDASLNDPLDDLDAQDLAQKGTNVQYYCFAITLPETEAANQALQGRVVFPAWHFAAKSD